ncbi:LacI family DNA-binding transcriptional regulator [Microbacterium sp. NPDC089698]|uniref:LacI family DNA-binding transcriptional regulator n=1 Tax=Microbacterium sp. NPDC089698 TaxID=3364200 RepID=UPI0038176AF7
MTLQTIADEVGVSRMTVSNAFSRPDQLSGALRDQIFEVANRLGYTGPDPAARALARGRTGVVGLVLGGSPREAFVDDVAVGFVRAVAAELADAGYSLVLLHSAPRAGTEPARNVAMDGAIIYSVDPQAHEVTVLRERGLAIVTVEGAEVEGIPRVAVDDAGGAEAAARHLVELGHRDIAVVTSGLDAAGLDPDSPHLSEGGTATTRARLRGWMRALAGTGARVRLVGTPGIVVDELLRSRVGQLLSEPPTAILAFSDLAALDVIAQAAGRGLRVPEDLSVVGFDDSPVASLVTPPLTTVHQDVAAKGATAARMLLSLLGSDRPVADVLLATGLVVRGSTSRPSTGA